MFQVFAVKEKKANLNMPNVYRGHEGSLSGMEQMFALREHEGGLQ